MKNKAVFRVPIALAIATIITATVLFQFQIIAWLSWWQLLSLTLVLILLGVTLRHQHIKACAKDEIGIGEGKKIDTGK